MQTPQHKHEAALLNNGGLYLFNTESIAVEIYMHWLVAMRGWLKFIEWYSKWLARAHQMMDAWRAAGAC